MTRYTDVVPSSVVKVTRGKISDTVSSPEGRLIERQAVDIGGKARYEMGSVEDGGGFVKGYSRLDYDPRLIGGGAGTRFGVTKKEDLDRYGVKDVETDYGAIAATSLLGASAVLVASGIGAPIGAGLASVLGVYGAARLLIWRSSMVASYFAGSVLSEQYRQSMPVRGYWDESKKSFVDEDVVGVPIRNEFDYRLQDYSKTVLKSWDSPVPELASVDVGGRFGGYQHGYIRSALASGELMAGNVPEHVDTEPYVRSPYYASWYSGTRVFRGQERGQGVQYVGQDFFSFPSDYYRMLYEMTAWRYQEMLDYEEPFVQPFYPYDGQRDYGWEDFDYDEFGSDRVYGYDVGYDYPYYGYRPWEQGLY